MTICLLITPLRSCLTDCLEFDFSGFEIPNMLIGFHILKSKTDTQ